MTPAQAYGHPDFVTDVPVQGPTDEGLRRADCKFARERLPAQPDCVDCKGTIPMWAQQSLATGHRGRFSGIGERLSFGGVGMPGFTLGAAGDPEVWSKMSAEQQAWIVATLTTLNNLIYQGTGTTCPTWGPTITAAGGCFQSWFNKNAKLTKPDGSPLTLRTDGVWDQDSQNALVTIAAMDPGHFPKAFPGGTLPGFEKQKTLSTGAMWGIGAGVAAVGGGIIYAATRGGKRKRRSRR